MTTDESSPYIAELGMTEAEYDKVMVEAGAYFDQMLSFLPDPQPHNFMVPTER